MKFFSTMVLVSSGLLISCSSGTNENGNLSFESGRISETENSDMAQLISADGNQVSGSRERKKADSEEEEKSIRNGRQKARPQNANLEVLTQKFLEKAELTALRKANVLRALEYLTSVKALPSKGLLEANAKCEKISESVEFLKKTTSPKHPFSGLRVPFRHELLAQRNALLKENGVESCAAVKNLLASLPPSTPVVPTAADEPVESADADDTEESPQAATVAIAP